MISSFNEIREEYSFIYIDSWAITMVPTDKRMLPWNNANEEDYGISFTVVGKGEISVTNENKLERAKCSKNAWVPRNLVPEVRTVLIVVAIEPQPEIEQSVRIIQRFFYQFKK